MCVCDTLGMTFSDQKGKKAKESDSRNGANRHTYSVILPDEIKRNILGGGRKWAWIKTDHQEFVRGVLREMREKIWQRQESF